MWGRKNAAFKIKVLCYVILHNRCIPIGLQLSKMGLPCGSAVGKCARCIMGDLVEVKAPIFWKVATFLDLCRRFPYPPLPSSHTLSGGETTGLPRALIGCGERNVTVTSPPLVERGAKLVCLFLFFSLVAICRPVATRTCFFALVFIIAMPFCCGYQCNSRSEKGFSLFNIPWGKRDVQRKKQWLHNIGRKDFAPTRRTSLCELHFTEDQFEPLILQKYGKKKLKPNAVPTLFSHRSAPKQQKPPAKRCEIHTHLHQGKVNFGTCESSSGQEHVASLSPGSASNSSTSFVGEKYAGSSSASLSVPTQQTQLAMMGSDDESVIAPVESLPEVSPEVPLSPQSSNSQAHMDVALSGSLVPVTSIASDSTASDSSSPLATAEPEEPLHLPTSNSGNHFITKDVSNGSPHATHQLVPTTSLGVPPVSSHLEASSQQALLDRIAQLERLQENTMRK
ncbi:uncharacterized protein LOC119160082 isoform X2 [Rhipicephalus microplus]|uniref:uncharacterized protein LOC119160082 isoform X2 n=1 Tax=Rhipicephalus microplus TaxID=6941 RepID=UPI003F6AF881